jgi:hypothetical protein
MLRESHTERAGVVYMLAEILTALHRQAEAQERIAQLLERIAILTPGVTDAI